MRRRPISAIRASRTPRYTSKRHLHRAWAVIGSSCYDTLLRDAVDAAAEMLSASDTFAPFMLVVDHTDAKQLRRSARSTTSHDEQTATRALEMARDRSTLRARAVVFDVTVSAPFTGDAVKVLLEHCDGFAVDVLVPYIATAEDLRVDLDAANAAVGTQALWA